MTTITTINSTDLITNSRADINTNFANLNSDKIETSTLDTDNTLANNSDAKIASQKAVKAYIDSQGANLAPTGAVTAYAGSSAPTGWLLCDGSAVSRATYATLFAITSTLYGAGNGTTTFNVPNLKGKIPVGFDAAETEFDTLGETGGEKTHVLTAAELAAHAHAIRLQTGTTTSGPYLGATGMTATGFANNAGTYTIDNNSPADGAHNNLQPYITLNYIIKT